MRHGFCTEESVQRELEQLEKSGLNETLMEIGREHSRIDQRGSKGPMDHFLPERVKAVLLLMLLAG